MVEEIKSLTIIPAYFVKNDGDKRIVRCLIGRDENNKQIVEEKRFDEYSTEGIKNPTYLFIGIKSTEEYQQINFTDAKDFKDMFAEKWDSLIPVNE